MGKIKSFFADFKTFITKGNILAMAVGVVIGGAFSAIVNAVVNHVLMPIVTLAVPGGLEGLVTVLAGGEVTVDTVNTVKYWGVVYDADTVNVINWGIVINALINFLIISFIMFLIIRMAMNAETAAARKKEIAGAFTREERKQLRAEGLSCRQIRIKAEEKIAADKEAAAKAAAEAEANRVTAEKLLAEIRDLLKEKK